MTDDDRSQPTDPDEVELARRLEAYAASRLAPSEAASVRMRAKVMAVALRGSRSVGPDTARPGTDRPSERSQGRRWRIAAGLLAACLTLAVVVGSVAAAQAGGPLYEARVWLESVTLPSSASERAAAEVRRLDARLVEAAAAADRSDQAAVGAALDAYGVIVAEAARAAQEATAAAILDAAVRRNIDVLNGLEGSVPEQARPAIRRAIDRSGTALDEIHRGPADPSRPAASPTERTTPATPEPTKPARPTGSPGPAQATPAPAKTPPGKASEAPAPSHVPDRSPPGQSD